MQEFVPVRDGHIIRVETLGGKYLYAIKVFTTGDIVQSLPGRRLPARRRRRARARRLRGRRAEDRAAGRRLHAAAGDHRAGRADLRRAGIDVGGIEYLVDDRDGKHYFYDINALSNFVADARERDRLRSVRAARGLPRSALARRRGKPTRWRRLMRYGYWLPVFGGWLRNVDDEGMAATWDYVKRLASAARRSATT